MAPLEVRAVNRPARILCEQTELASQALRHGVDVLFNPGFTAPVFGPCPSVTVFHDLQHKRQPENFRWFDLPFWRMLLYASAHRSKHLLADSEATRDDLLRFYRLAPEKITVAPLGVDPAFFALTTTPSMRPSALERTCPAKATEPWWARLRELEATRMSVTAKPAATPGRKVFVPMTNRLCPEGLPGGVVSGEILCAPSDRFKFRRQRR